MGCIRKGEDVKIYFSVIYLALFLLLLFSLFLSYQLNLIQDNICSINNRLYGDIDMCKQEIVELEDLIAQKCFEIITTP